MKIIAGVFILIVAMLFLFLRIRKWTAKRAIMDEGHIDSSCGKSTDAADIMGKSKVDLGQLKPMLDSVVQADKTIKTPSTFAEDAAGSSTKSSMEPVFDCEQVEVFLEYISEGEDEIFDDDEIPFEMASGYSFEQMSQVVQLFETDQSVEMVAEAGTLEIIKDLESAEFFEQLMNEKSANASRIKHLIESYIPLDIDLPETDQDESKMDSIDSDFDINNYL